MKIGNNPNFDMTALLRQIQNLKNSRFNANMMGASSQLSPIQPRPDMPLPEGWSPPADPLSFRQFWDGGLSQSLLDMGWTQEKLEARQWYHDPVNYATAFLHGREGKYGSIGMSAFQQRLSERGIELPDDIRFDISVNSLGGVTLTGLDDAELTSKIEDALSYDASFINSVLSTFTQSERILAGTNTTQSRNGMSGSQFFKMQVHQFLRDLGSGLDELSLDSYGNVQGLSQELHDEIFRDLGTINSDEKYVLLILQHNIPALLSRGLDSIPAPDISLTFDSGRMIVNI